MKTRVIVAEWDCDSTPWRVKIDPLQWILQWHNKGGWYNRSYCVTREALLRCVREYCGEIDPKALSALKALPEWHLDRQSGDAIQ